MTLARATRYTEVRAAANRRPASPAPATRVASKRPHLFVPKRGAFVGVREYFWRELREGGRLQRMFAAEQARADARYRRVAQQTDGFQQNNRSDLRRVATVPLLDFLRWHATDPDFFQDDANLRSLRRDNPDARVYL